MTLFTSRYAAGPLIVASGLVPVRISRGGPRFKVPYRIAGVCRPLIPPRGMTSGYMDMLDGHGLDAIEADQQGHRHHDLWLLAVATLDLTPDQQIEFLICAAHLHVSLEGYRIVGLR